MGLPIGQCDFVVSNPAGTDFVPSSSPNRSTHRRVSGIGLIAILTFVGWYEDLAGVDATGWYSRVGRRLWISASL